MHILIVDDDQLTCKLVKFILAEEGIEVDAVNNSHAMFSHLEHRQPDLVILDVMMPEADGFELCKKLRSVNSDAAIIFLSARCELSDRISGLELGADDYMVKPFEPAELVAKVKALMRRYRRSQEAPYVTRFRAGNLELRVGELQVIIISKKGSRGVSLTPTEMRLLRILMINADRVVSREALLNSIWGDGVTTGGSQVIDVYMRRLRKKLEEDPSNPTILESVRGSGYKFNSTSKKWLPEPAGPMIVDRVSALGSNRDAGVLETAGSIGSA